ncbi:MAG: acyloxyacyl hydrolase [Deltaproteobacteria bacterium]|nr:acyloxyacyl hydrolase [Deltaproteobacteria bacterium]
MRLKTIWLMLLLLNFCSPQPGSAGETDWIAVGLRAGLSATDGSENFEQYEMFATHGLPWSWQLTPGWFLSTNINLSAGALRGGGETGFIGSVGPSVTLSMVQDLILLDGGISAALLSEHKFGQENFGGPIQFVSHVGIRFKLGGNLGVGYRFQHMSNASIYNRNPGLELHMLELSYFF